jgi:hypothetical protein
MKKILISALVLFLVGTITTQAALVNVNTVYDTVENTLNQVRNAATATFRASTFTATSTTATSTLPNTLSQRIQSLTSAGLQFFSNSGALIADFGAGGGNNATFFGGLNANGQIQASNFVASSTSGTSTFAGAVTVKGNELQYRLFVTVGTSSADYITDGTDDQVEINAALTSARLNNRTLYIKEGVYNISSPIEARSSIILSKEATIKAVSSMEAVLNFGATASNLNEFIEGGIFDGNNLATTTVWIRQAQKIKVSNIMAKNGIMYQYRVGDDTLPTHVYSAYFINFDSVRDIGFPIAASSSGLYVESTATDNQFFNGTLVDSEIGVHTDGATNMFSDIHVWTSPSKGWMNVGFYDTAGNNVYKGIISDTPRYHGMLFTSDKNIVDSASIINNSSYGEDNVAHGITDTSGSPIISISNTKIIGGDSAHRFASDYNIPNKDGTDMISIVAPISRNVVSSDYDSNIQQTFAATSTVSMINMLSVGDRLPSTFGGSQVLGVRKTLLPSSGNVANIFSQLSAFPPINSSANYYSFYTEAGDSNTLGINYTGSFTGLYTTIRHRDSGTIANAYGVVAGSPTWGAGAGINTNQYGVFIERQNFGASTTNAYGIYQASSTDQNYFAGLLSIGTTSTSSTLNVGGSIRSDTTQTLGTSSIKTIVASSSQISGLSGGLTLTNLTLSNLSSSNNTGVRTSFVLSPTAGSALGYMDVVRTNSPASGGTYIAFASHNGTSVVEKLRIAESGNIGIATSTPTAQLSVQSNTLGKVIANFFANTGSSTVEISQATTTVRHGSSLVGFLQASLARLTVGIENAIGYYRSGRLFGALTIKGLFFQEDWNQVDCSALVGATQIIADGITGCDGFSFYEDGTATLTSTANGGAVFGRLSTSAANDGAGVFLNAPTGGFLLMATSTPVFEAVARIHTVQNQGTTTQTYIGFTNLATAGTAYETAPTAGCFFTASSTTPNWRAICRTSLTAQTNVDTGVASTTVTTGQGEPYRFMIEADADGAKFYLQSSEGGSLTNVANINTTVPTTTTMNAGVHFGRNAAVTAVGVDVYDMNIGWRKFLAR